VDVRLAIHPRAPTLYPPSPHLACSISPGAFALRLSHASAAASPSPADWLRCAELAATIQWEASAAASPLPLGHVLLPQLPFSHPCSAPVI